MNKYPRVHRVHRHTEENTPFIIGIWQSIVGVFLWLFFIVVTGITIYSHWFSQALIYILKLFKDKIYHVPLWFSVVFTIFLFPITLITILVSSFLQIIRGK